jgi:TatD DNase family protein
LTLFDTHAHLWWSDFDSDRDEVLARARAAGVREVLNLGTTVATSRTCLALAERESLCWAAVGLHPNDLQEYVADPAGSIAAIETLCTRSRVVAIGETGLDFYREHTDPEVQLAALRDHLELGRRTGLPVVLHNRRADTELREAVAMWGEGVTAVFHCFTGDEAFGRWAIERGHYLGLGGVLTFRSSDLREQVAAWDLDRILLETDSPFLAPAPHRGKRNEPALITVTAGVLAEALGREPAELAERTRANAFRVFPKCTGGG